MTTGLRLGEILALTWDDLDMKNKTISVNKQVQRIGSELKVTTPKTASSIRTIALCDECFNQLILLRSRQRFDKKLIFPSPITGGLRDPLSVTRKTQNAETSSSTANTLPRFATPLCQVHDKKIFIISYPHDPASLIGVLPPPVSVRRQKTHEVAPFVPAAYTQKLCRLFCNKTQFA